MLCVRGSFEDHDGFDGVMLGWDNADWHLEFSYWRHHRVTPCPTQEDLLVLYVDEQLQCFQDKMLQAGFISCDSFNPWWDAHGVTFRDFDGYGIVLCRGNGKVLGQSTCINSAAAIPESTAP